MLVHLVYQINPNHMHLNSLLANFYATKMEAIYAVYAKKILHGGYVWPCVVLSRAPNEDYDDEDFRPKYKPKLKSPKMKIKTKFVSEKSEKPTKKRPKYDFVSVSFHTA